MLGTIELDDQVALETGEIDDKWTDRHLPAELGAPDLPVAETEPEQTLGVGHVVT
jgi:hypothetical protein